METTVNNGMCRCCASEGAFKDVKSTYHWMGEEEIYADMLRDCFDISLNVSEQGTDGGICEVCITQLRNAINFKKQVLHTEEQFKKHLQNKTLFRPNIVKVEVNEDDDSDDNNASGDDGFSGAEYEVPIKTEVDDPKPKKRGAKATTSRAKKTKTDNGETSTKRVQEKVKRKTESVDTAVLVIVEPEKSVKKSAQDKSRRCLKEELAKHQHNLRVILQCTNATPILRRGSLGYMCSYCTKEFPEAMDLKKHTLTTHANEKDPATGYMKTAPMSEYCIKLDITNLNCTLCGADIDSLENLMVHLKDEHDKTIHLDINNHIMPFKFDTEQLTCCLCSNPYEKFKKLQEHMHNHYRNYICDVCDTGFVTQGCLSRHANIHVKGEFPCKYCSKVFDTYLKTKSHERCNHTHTTKLNRCGYCNEGFRDHHLKELHLYEAHGVDRKVYKCNACDKSYSLLKKLKIHIKRDHLLERGHKCVHCDMRFFTSHDVKKHMVKHTGVKEFQCAVCWKSFGRKSTLNGHMRIHNDDRRFKCVHCGMSFVQKCSWKGHMKAKHGELV